jgi:hypothetical protein
MEIILVFLPRIFQYFIQKFLILINQKMDLDKLNQIKHNNSKRIFLPIKIPLIL